MIRVALALALSALLWCGAQAQFSVGPKFGSGGGFSAPVVSGGGAGCSQATTWLSGKTTTWSAAYTTLICGMVTDGTYALLDRFYVLATDSSTNALADIITNTAATLSATAPTFTANSGYLGNGASAAILTGLNFSTATNYTQNSASTFAWSTEVAADNGNPIGAASGTADNYFQIFSFSGTDTWRINAGAFANSATLATGVGMHHGSLVGGTLTIYINGVVSGTPSTGYTTSAKENTTFQGLGGGSGFYGGNVGAFGAGAGFTATQVSNLYSRVHTFLHTVNATLYP